MGLVRERAIFSVPSCNHTCLACSCCKTMHESMMKAECLQKPIHQARKLGRCAQDCRLFCNKTCSFLSRPYRRSPAFCNCPPLPISIMHTVLHNRPRQLRKRIYLADGHIHLCAQPPLSCSGKLLTSWQSLCNGRSKTGKLFSSNLYVYFEMVILPEACSCISDL